MRSVVAADASVIADQARLVEAIEARTALRTQMGSAAYDELLSVVMQLGDVARVNSIWIDTLYPRVLAALERDCPNARPAICRVRQVLEERRFRGVRLTRDEQRMTDNPFDTWEEKLGLV